MSKVIKIQLNPDYEYCSRESEYYDVSTDFIFSLFGEQEPCYLAGTDSAYPWYEYYLQAIFDNGTSAPVRLVLRGSSLPPKNNPAMWKVFANTRDILGEVLIYLTQAQAAYQPPKMQISKYTCQHNEDKYHDAIEAELRLRAILMDIDPDYIYLQNREREYQY